MTATIRYMGSKRSLAPAIADLITRAHPTSTVADAFAGTCAIGTALAPRHRILANDVHEFATVIARSLLSASPPRPTVAAAARELRTAYQANLAALQPALTERLTKERTAISRVRRSGGWVELRDFTLHELVHPVPRELPGLPSLAAYRASPGLEPFALFSMYFASAFFGVEQAAEIDSLRFAIAQANPQNRDFYLLALLQAVSHCGASPGHFAQHLTPRTESNTKYIARIRNRSVYKRFFEALGSIDLPRCLRREQNGVHCMEAEDFVRSVLNEQEGPLVIYADPPYSRAQYSRYYHVQETLVLYDYPAATGKGRYRGDRFNTGFSRKAKVAEAMEEFVAAAADTRSALFLSYPKNGLLYQTGSNLLDILGDYYPLTSIASTTPLAHSTLGGAPGSASIDVLEDVYYARWY